MIRALLVQRHLTSTRIHETISLDKTLSPGNAAQGVTLWKKKARPSQFKDKDVDTKAETRKAIYILTSQKYGHYSL